MPLVITRPPDPNDPDYQKLEQLINLAVHTAAFAAFNSGLWVWPVSYTHLTLPTIYSV